MVIDPQRIINSVTDGVLTIDNKGNIIQANPAAQKIFGEKGKKIIGSNMKSITKVAELKRFLNKKISKIKMKLDGKFPKIYRITVFPILKRKKLEGQIILAEDVTREESLLESQRQLTNLISQKLQIPVNTIRSYVDIFLSGKIRKLPKEAQELVRSAYQGNERLIKTINNVLDMLDLENTEIVIKKEKNTSIDNLIKEAVSDFDEQARTKGLKLVYKKPKEKLPLLNISSLMISKVLKHLLDNAIKFTKKGSVTISTRRDKDKIIVSVADTGVGISEREQRFLFQRFLRLSKTQTTKEELGLGLYICHMIVEKHGGRIWVRSKKNKGSTFSFSLPLK